MWAEAASTIATPLYTGVITVAFSVAAILVMYLSAGEAGPPTYETRRSMLLLDAIRLEAEKLHERDTAKPPVRTGVVCLRSELEKQCWSDRFGIPPEALKSVVQHVGPMAPDVGRYLENLSLPQPQPRRPRRYSAPSLSIDELWPNDHRDDWFERAVPVVMGVSGSAAINALMLVSAFS